MIFSSRHGVAALIAFAALGLGASCAPKHPKTAWNKGGKNEDRIVYASDRDGDVEVYSMNPDGSDQRRLTQSPGADASPSWSGDKQHVAFTSERHGGSRIFVMGADGSDPQEVTSGPADAAPAWGPGDLIAFETNVFGSWDVAVVSKDGGTPKALTDSGARDTSPSWSPDASRVAFVSDRDGLDQIYVMNADGSGVVRVTKSETPDRHPAWSKSGKIAFVRDDPAGAKYFTIDADGTGEAEIGVAGGPPDWSPAGDVLVFAAPGKDGRGVEIETLQPGGSAKAITSFGAKSSSPCW